MAKTRPRKRLPSLNAESPSKKHSKHSTSGSASESDLSDIPPEVPKNPLISTLDVETTAPLVATQDSVTRSAVPISPVAEATDAAGGDFSTTNKLSFDSALDIPLPNSDDDFSSDEDDGAASAPVIVKSVASTTSTNRTVLDEVLQPDCMKNHYLGLPWVPPPSKLLPYSSASADAHEVENADFDLLCTTLSLNAVACLKLGLVFSRYKNVVNLSKAPQSSLLRNYEGYASVADLGGPRWKLAILVLTGVCVGSHLHQPTGSTGFKNKKMLLKLFNQEYELAEGQLGAYYHSDSFYGPMSSGTLTFQTKKENQQGGASRPFSGSPSKGNCSKFVSGSPRKSAVTTGSEQFTIKNLTVSPFLEWDAEIPVYDGRARSQSKYQGFSFALKDWDSLTSLPRYLKELPDDAVVTVGFTLTAWSIAELPTAHFFIAFVILLALPVKN